MATFPSGLLSVGVSWVEEETTSQLVSLNGRVSIDYTRITVAVFSIITSSTIRARDGVFI